MEVRSVRIVNLVPAVLIGFALFLAWRATARVAQPLLLITLALVIASGLNPLVVWANERLGLPRAAGAAIMLFLLLGGLGGLGWLLVPTLINQLSSLIGALPVQVAGVQDSLVAWAEARPFARSLGESLRNLDLSRQLQSILPNTLLGALGTTATFLSGLLNGLLLLLLGFFVLAQPEPLLLGALSGLPLAYRDRVNRTLTRVGTQLGSWVVATVILSAVMGLLVGLGLSLLGLAGIRVQDIFLFSVIAGVTQVIPVIGPLFGLIPPVLVSLSPVPINALWVGLTVFAAQQVVFQLLTPIVFGRGVNLHPASLLAGVLLFAGLFGVVGAFLAVPFLIILKALYEEVYLPALAAPPVTDSHVESLVEGELPGGA